MYVFYVHVHNSDMHDFPLENISSMKLKLLAPELFFFNFSTSCI